MSNQDKAKPRVAVHKFSSCDGCQLAFLNLGEPLLQLMQRVDIVHFPEAGPYDEETEVEVAFVEGSVATPHDVERLSKIRQQSRYLVAIGACATAGGIQALRNMHDAPGWISGVYAQPQHIELLDQATPIAEHVRVDLALWGCPVNGQQVVGAVNALLAGYLPKPDLSALCLECKRQGNICVMVTQGIPCLGPITHTGCGSICPHMQRDCYGCFGPVADANMTAFGARLSDLGLTDNQVADRLHFINSHAEPTRASGMHWRDKAAKSEGNE